MKEKLFAVLTGDIANSSRFKGNDRRKLLDLVKHSFAEVKNILGDDVMAFPFEIFRGDSFQGVLQNPEEALRAAIIIRASIRAGFRVPLSGAADARIAVGVGTISLMPVKSSGEGDGAAYRNSGPELDKMPKHSRMMIIKTPWHLTNEELNVECAMLDTIISRWSSVQAEVVMGFLKGLTQEEMAKIFDVSQPAVKKRISSANMYPIELMLHRFENIFKENYNLVGL